MRVELPNQFRLGAVVGRETSSGHHPDYNQPMKVVWLCRLHHKEAHKLMKASALPV